MVHGEIERFSDSLSRDYDRSDKELTHILRTFVPSQVPEHFVIVQLPNEIVSWLTSLLQQLPVKTQLQEKRMKTNLGRESAGRNIATLSESEKTTASSMTSLEEK